MKTTPEKQNKRRDLRAWREARYERLLFEVKRGYATEQQKERVLQLERMLR